MGQKFKNNARALLVSAISDTATSITIEAGKADLFPSANVGNNTLPSANNWFKATMQDAIGNVEIIYVRTRTAGSGILADVLRGQEATTAIAWPSGTVIGLRITAQDIEDSIALGLNSVQSTGNQTIAGIKTFLDQIEANVKGTVSHPFPAGTRMPFAQASAPTGWTQDTTDNANNRMLRVVNTAGGGVAGTHSPIVNNVVPSHTHGFSTGSVSSDHSHYVSGTTSGVGNHTHSMGRGYGPEGYTPFNGISLTATTFPGSAETTQGGGAHSHTFGAQTGGISANHTHSGSTDNGSSQTNWTPRYIDMIICSKNA